MKTISSHYLNNTTKVIYNEALLEALAIANVAQTATENVLLKNGQSDFSILVKKELNQFFAKLPLVVRTNNEKKIESILKRLNLNIDKALKLSAEDSFVEKMGTSFDKLMGFFGNLVSLTAKKVKLLTNINKVDKKFNGGYIHKARIQYNFGGHLWLFQYDDGGINPRSAVYYVDGHNSPTLNESLMSIKNFLNLLSLRTARKLSEVFLKKEASKRSTVVEYAKRMADIINVSDHNNLLLVSAMALNVVHGSTSKLNDIKLYTEIEKVLDETILIKDFMIKSDVIELFVSSR